MSTTGLATFDNTVEKTNTWLNELRDRLHFDSKQEAYLGLRATLHALRDRLPVQMSAALAAQLPMLIRGLYFEGWRPAAVPTRLRSEQAFLDVVRAELPEDIAHRASDIVRETLAVVEQHVSPGEAEKVKKALPDPIRNMWSQAA